MGWREWISLPQLGLAVKAKVDTGARSCALHAFDVEKFTRGGHRYVRFKVHPVQRDERTTVATEAPLIGEKRVRDSGGRVSLRPVIETKIQIEEESWRIELTLTRRDVMGFRMLLGRQSIRGRYVVDPGRSFLLGKPRATIRSRKAGKKKAVRKRGAR